jgi:hypothetical protein
MQGIVSWERAHMPPIGRMQSIRIAARYGWVILAATGSMRFGANRSLSLGTPDLSRDVFRGPAVPLAVCAVPGDLA